MKTFYLLFFIIFFCTLNPRISAAEPGFFFQTLSSKFVDWVFGRIDTYMEDDTSKIDKNINKKDTPKSLEKLEKKVSIPIDEIVERDDTYYKKFSNIPFTGHIESYYQNGQLKIIGEFSDGKKISKWVEYYISGVKKSEGHYIKGKKNGKWLYYFLNSKIKEKQFYIDGNKDGLWEKFDVDGSIKQTESYQNGKWIITTIN